MSVQAQWSLNQSSSSAIGVARGILQAATTDNVQVLAILACEQFGATLAISPETCLKMERVVVPTPKPAVLEFLKVTVGYLSNDCATQLGRSLAGLNFLALATALVTSMDAFTAATAIQAMVVQTAVEKVLVPTVRQVQDLLGSIEPRATKADFANDVYGWQTWLSASSHAYFKAGSYGAAPGAPSAEGIQDLVDAFRQLRRVGAADISGIVIHTTANGAAWTTSFTKWCLGLPPSIAFDDGTSYLAQKDSEVAVVISEANNRRGVFKVAIHSSVKSPVELVETHIGEDVIGMVDIPAFGKQLLRLARNIHRHDTGVAMRAFYQAVPYALAQVLDKLVLVDQIDHDRPIRRTAFNAFADQEMAEPPSVPEDARSSPFPLEAAISEMATHLLGLDKPAFKRLGEGLLLADLPLMKPCLKDIEAACSCNQCEPDGKPTQCRKAAFFDDLSRIITAILSLSLFENPEGLRVHSQAAASDRNHFSNPLVHAVFIIITKGVYAQCPVISLAQWALVYVGHPCIGDLDDTGPVLSSYKGQAVWPTINQTHDVRQRNYLSLSWHPGSLILRNEIFSVIRNRTGGTMWSGKDWSPPGDVNDPVLEPVDVCPPNMELEWSIAPQAAGILEASLCVTTMSPTQFATGAGATYIMLTRTAFVDNCPHHPNAPLPEPDGWCLLTDPLNPELKSPAYNLEEHHICVVGVNGRSSLQFLTLSNIIRQVSSSRVVNPVVVRKSACLECCIDMCRRIGSTVLIL